MPGILIQEDLSHVSVYFNKLQLYLPFFGFIAKKRKAIIFY